MKRYNKFLSCLLCIVILSASVYNLSFAGDTSDYERFDLSVNILPAKSYNSVTQKFKPLDLAPYANNSLRDDVDGDGKGGWSDQGANDLRNFNLVGTHSFLGVPFSFLDPAKMPDKKSVIGLQGQNDRRLPNHVEIEVNDIAAGVYFMHASPWSGAICGTYSFVYEDGMVASFDIESGVHIKDHYGKQTDSEFVRAAWIGKTANPLNLDGDVTVCLFALNNPYPQKKISKLYLDTDGSGAYIMILGITFTDSGPFLPAIDDSAIMNPATYNWYKYEQPNVDSMSGTAIDVSYLLDAPAGKHGALKAKGDDFYFEDGAKAKFWGANIVGKAVFPEKEQAENIAKRLSMAGFNLVRFTEFDEYITEDNVEKLSYLLGLLKSKGIYYSFAFASRDEYKVLGYFDEKLKEKQINELNAVLGHHNEHTACKIGNDTALAMIEFTNNNSIFDYNGASFKMPMTDEQSNYFKKEFNEYIQKKYNTTANLKKAWTSESDLQSFETVEAKSINLNAWKYTLFSQTHKKDILDFLDSLQAKYYTDLKNAASKIGVTAPMTVNSNRTDSQYSNFNGYKNSNICDFISYQSTWNKYTNKYGVLNTFDYYDNLNSMIANPYCGFIGDFAKQRIHGAPFVASAWSIAAPNAFVSEAQMVMAAFSAEQNWTPIQYSFIQGEMYSENEIKDLYSAVNNPVRSALMPAAAITYYTTDENAKKHKNTISETDLYTMPASFEDSNKNLLESRYGSSILNSSESKGLNQDNKDLVKTDNILLDFSDKIFTIETDYVNAFSGIIYGTEELPYMQLALDSDRISVVMAALGGKKIAEADNILLTIAGDCRNTNQKIDTHFIVNSGSGPILVEPGIGEVVLKLKGNYSIYSLTSSGERKRDISAKKTKEGYIKFTISDKDEASQFEIVKK